MVLKKVYNKSRMLKNTEIKKTIEEYLELKGLPKNPALTFEDVTIIDLFSDNSKLTNEKIRNELNVSERSVIRYMDELERQGKVKQAGATGRKVSYSLA